MEKRVFISYSRQDREFVQTLKVRLERNGISCWLDTDEMVGDEKWRNQILAALDQATYLVLVLSPASLASEVVAWEWKQARQRGVCVQPLVAEGYTVKELTPLLKRWMRDNHIHSIGDDNWETLIGQLKAPCQAHRVPKPNAPALPNNYVQRDDLFLPLRERLLQADRDKLVAMTTSLQGGGGFGKTVLASALCHDLDVIDTYDDGVYWVTVGQNPDIYNLIANLYEAFTGQRRTVNDPDSARKALVEALADKECLLVLDDVWKPIHLEILMTGGEQCVRLVTTRSRDVALEAGEPLDVREMETSEATAVLKKAFANAPAVLADLDKLAKRLGEWPLLLNIAFGILRKEARRAESPAAALKFLNDNLNHLVIDFTHNPNPTEEERYRSAAASIEFSLSQLEKPHYRELFYQLGIFAEDQPIYITSAAALWQGENAGLVLRAFDDLSLLQTFDGLKATLHDVVRQYCIAHMGDAKPLHTQLVNGYPEHTALPDEYGWNYLSYHLVEAGMIDELAALLLNFDYLYAKLEATDPDALLIDFERLPHDSFDPDMARALTLVERLIGMDAHIMHDPHHLPSHILGRLGYIAGENTAIDALCEATNRVPFPFLQPQTTSLRPVGNLLRTINTGQGELHNVHIQSISDGRRRIFVAGNDGTIRILDGKSYKEIGVLIGHTQAVLSVTVTSDGRVVSASRDQTLRVWDFPTCLTVAILEGHTQPVNTVLIHPDGFIVSGSNDSMIIVWNVENYERIATFKEHSNSVYDLQVDLEGLLVSV